MAQPASLPRWATIGAVITVPPSGQLDTGWVVNQAPPAGYFNWYMNLVYQWTVYVQNLTAEVLTWTGQQTFSDTIIGNKGITLTAPSQATPPGPHSTSVGIDYTGASTTIVAGTGFSATGGASTNGVGGVGLRGEGGSGALEGGTGVVGVGQAGVTAGTGVIGLGGDASDAAGLGGYGARFTGGQNLTSDKGGTGAVITGADGSIWNGNGTDVTAGDLTGQGIGTVLRTSLTVRGGSCYTDGTKATLGSTPNVESVLTVIPGKMNDGSGSASVTGLEVRELVAGAQAPFAEGHWGLKLGSGFLLRQEPISTSLYPAGSAVDLPYGTLSPWGIAGVACALTINGGAGGGSFTANFTAGTDRFNTASVARLNATTFRVTFTNSFLSTNSYFPVVQGNRSNLMPRVSQLNTGSIDIAFTNFTSTIDLDASSESNIPVWLMCFGR